MPILAVSMHVVLGLAGYIASIVRYATVNSSKHKLKIKPLHDTKQ